MNIQQVIQGGLRLGRLVLGKVGEDFKYLVPVALADISTASTVYAVASHAGRITKITAVINGAIITADAVLTPKINGVAVTGGNVTITQVGSAAGDIDSSTPTAAYDVEAGDLLSVTTNGASGNTVIANVTFEIDPSL